MAARIAEYPELFEERTGLGEGDPDASLRVIEFFDYRCIPCKTVHPDLVSLTERRPELRIEMRQLPILSPGSERAARFALATREVYGDAVYRAVHDQLWTMSGPMNNAGFQRIADALDLDFSAIAPAMDSEPVSRRINYNRDVAIALEVLGTPAFITPETVVAGAADIEALAELWFSR